MHMPLLQDAFPVSRSRDNHNTFRDLYVRFEKEVRCRLETAIGCWFGCFCGHEIF